MKHSIVCAILIAAPPVLAAQQIVVGPNVAISGARARDSHSEPVIAADPNHPERLLAASHIAWHDTAGTKSIAYASFDTGRTWTVSLEKRDSTITADAAVAYGVDGSALFATLARWGMYRSRDGGRTWEDSAGRALTLPITAASADYAARIPQGSELINQTSMAADAAGHPYIASYWRTPESAVPQYRILYHDGSTWRRLDLGFRTAPFSLSGGGTKAIPIARPQLLIEQREQRGAAPSGVLVFRDHERGDRASMVDIADFGTQRWKVADLDPAPLGAWEPTVDTEAWRLRGELDLFVQPVRQVDGEGLAKVPPSNVRVLQWRPRHPSPTSN